MPANVLVVDDDGRICELVTRWLAKDGHACLAAADAQAAWRHLEAGQVDLLTLDLRLGAGSGIHLLYQVQKTWPDVAVIVISGVNDTQTAIEALTSGACAYLVKPLKRDQLIFHVRRALERRRLALDNRRRQEQLEESLRRQAADAHPAPAESTAQLRSASVWRECQQTVVCFSNEATSCGVPAEATAGAHGHIPP